MRDLEIAVIGYGQRGVLARHAHQPGDGARVVAVCDPRARRRDEALGDFGTDVTLVADYRDLLDAGLDAVMVITPDHTHEDVVTAFLRHGVAVFVEKPLAITTESCDRILQAAADSGSRLYVGHNMRHMPVVRTMRKLIEAGAIGAVKSIWCRHFVGHGGDYYFKDWHADRRNTTSLLLQKGAHDIDVIHWLAGGYTRRVQAMGDLVVYGGITQRQDRSDETMPQWFDPEANWPPLANTGLNPVIDVEDLSVVNMSLDNGVLATYQQCHFTPDYWRNYTVIGTRGRMENFGDDDGATVRVWNQRRSGYRSDADLEVPVAGGVGGHGGSDPVLVNEFLNYVRTGGATATTPVAARYAVATGCAATASLRDSANNAVDVPPLDAKLAGYWRTAFTAAP